MIPDQQPSVPAPLTIEQLTAQHAALPALQPVRHGRPRKNISAPALAPAPAPLTVEQLAAQRAVLPDLVQPVRHGRPRKTIPAPAPAPVDAPSMVVIR